MPDETRTSHRLAKACQRPPAHPPSQFLRLCSIPRARPQRRHLILAEIISVSDLRPGAVISLPQARGSRLHSSDCFCQNGELLNFSMLVCRRVNDRVSRWRIGCRVSRSLGSWFRSAGGRLNNSSLACIVCRVLSL